VCVCVCVCVSQPSDPSSVIKLLSDTKTLREILEEAGALLRMFWRAALPTCEETKQVRANGLSVYQGEVREQSSDGMEHAEDNYLLLSAQPVYVLISR